jgi:hypothetical protein
MSIQPAFYVVAALNPSPQAEGFGLPCGMRRRQFQIERLRDSVALTTATCTFSDRARSAGALSSG